MFRLKKEHCWLQHLLSVRQPSVTKVNLEAYLHPAAHPRSNGHTELGNEVIITGSRHLTAAD